MKTIIIITVLLLSGCGLKNEKQNSAKVILPNYNHSTSGRLSYQRKLQTIAKIKKDEAIKIAKRSCTKSELSSTKLRHHNSKLFYEIRGENCFVKIDAMSGRVIYKDNS